MMKISRAGFTLAEVLTTLMVIGVVAAMTIPTLMNSTEDQQRKVALKKAVSVLGQAVQLNKAKEVECTFPTSNTEDAVALCIAKSLAGTVSDDTITTADGMSYKFYAAAPTTTQYSLEDLCGSTFDATQEGWKGANACGVIVDINGASKGTSFTDADANLPTFAATGFSAEPGQKDLYSLILTDAGVRPTLFSTTSRGYEFMYGAAPANLNDIFGKMCECQKAGDADPTMVTPISDASGNPTCDGLSGWATGECTLR